MSQYFLKFTFINVCLLTMCPFVLAKDIDYATQIKPILETKCYACHGVIKQEAELRLDSKELMVKGGDSGTALVPSKPKQSLLLERITDDEFSRMPPADEGSALKPEEVKLVRLWIEQGASAPQEDVALDPIEHWAFQPIRSPKEAGTSIDKLLAKQRALHGLKTQPQAERSILIRRVYLDLIGLPPTIEQLHDERPWEEIVNELLASPQYGERWGRHWMDIWRYSDWYGLGAQLRYSQKHLWHWRDWIVNSLNTDKGYDQMILEMLAGDELAPDDLEVVAATGFLARNYYLFNRTTWLDSTIEHTGKAFLGLTLNCAKCHDHKYDPISHQDYYNFRSIFEPHQVRLDPFNGELDLEKDGLPRVFDDHLDAKTSLHIKGDPTKPDDTVEISPQVPALLASFQPGVEPVSLPVFAYAPALREEVIVAQRSAFSKAVQKAKQELEAAKKSVTQKTAEVAGQEAEPQKKEFSFFDDFNEPRPDIWEITGSNWQYSEGKLLRTTSTREPETVRFRGEIPEDFEVTCQYTTTGGSTYKSVTFRFDQLADRAYDNFVYTSAHGPGPKLQAAFTRNGSSTYPPQGRIGRPIEVGKEYTFRFAVKGKLLNVWLNDEFVLAYTYPDRKPEGSLALSGFDATVAFDSINIRSLPDDFEMQVDSSSKDSSSLDPLLALKIAESNYQLALLREKSFEKTLTADQATYGTNADSEIDELKNLAAVAQAEASLASAQHELLLASEDKKKVTAANKKITSANKSLANAKQGKGKYKSLRASLKSLETPAHKATDYAAVYPSQSTGRRLSLAQWMVDQKNPLTARVAVNHIWLRHFGKPLVESVFDFGLRAKKPQQLELLDYLAWELMESGWSMKHLHRLIVTSEAYQLSSSTLNADAETISQDLTNEYYWRMNTRRMESQVIRDNLLKLAETIDLTMGGPSVDVGEKSRRRSIYFKHSRDQQDKFLTMFDDADLLQCYRRDTSVVPQQALALSNSQLSLTMSQLIAEKIQTRNKAKTFVSFVELAFETILCRMPTEEELSACRSYFKEIRELLQANFDQNIDTKIRSRFVHSLLNHNDFISIR